MSTAGIVILVIVVLAVLLAAGWYFSGAARSRKLRNRFGPEYDRHVEAAENRRVAERELAEREKRHAQLTLKPLSAEAKARHTARWTEIQERFVDEPREALVEADELVHGVMRERGYPTEGFDQQAADLSVEHAKVVSHYRDGHEIRARHDEASTEELRRALVHYRAIFNELVGEKSDHRAEADVSATREPVDAQADGHVQRDGDRVETDPQTQPHVNNR